MPIRPSQFRAYGDLDTYTDGQQLIYLCESETLLRLPGIVSFEEWAGVVDDVWLKIRHRAENGPADATRRIKTVRIPDEEIVPCQNEEDRYNYDRFHKQITIPMSEVPVWIEKYPPELTNIKWSALWSEPNVIVAGHRPLHVMTAVHEVAHLLVYYQHGWRLDEPDNGHGPIWKRTYMDLLNEFLPKHAEVLHATFKEKGVDI